MKLANGVALVGYFIFGWSYEMLRMRQWKLLILLLGIAGCRSAAVSQDDSNLLALNGLQSDKYDFLVMISSMSNEIHRVSKKPFRYLCTGFYVTAQWIATADHCVDDKHSFTVTKKGMFDAEVTHYIRHPAESLWNGPDIAFVKVSEMSFAGEVPVISLKEYPEKTPVEFGGYGSTALRKATCFTMRTKPSYTCSIGKKAADGETDLSILVMPGLQKCEPDHIQEELLKPYRKHDFDRVVRECGETTVANIKVPDIQKTYIYHAGAGSKTIGNNILGGWSRSKTNLIVEMQDGALDHNGTIPLKGDSGSPLLIQDFGLKAIGTLSVGIGRRVSYSAYRSEEALDWLVSVTKEVGIPLHGLEGLDIKPYKKPPGYQTVKGAPRVSQSTSAGMGDGSNQGAGIGEGLLDCYHQFGVIRSNPGLKGICVNKTSGYPNCYRYSDRNVWYERGQVACPKS